MSSSQPSKVNEFDVSEYQDSENDPSEFRTSEYRTSEFQAQPRESPAARVRPRSSEKVSVIVTARDYGRFLEDCLHSILCQTHRPDEIIYCDDGSSDDSVAKAGRFSVHGVRTIPLSHGGVVDSRNRAFTESSGDRLLFVDGDNVLAPDFIEKAMQTLDREPGTSFAYAGKQYFGNQTKRWDPPEWDRSRLWVDNFVDTSALIRREVFEAAGRWQESGAGTMWDWDLFLRASRFDPGRKSDALLFYRDHGQNWSSRIEQPRSELKGRIRRAAAHLTVCNVFSGRMGSKWNDWLDALMEGLQPVGREKPGLFIIDDSPEGFWSAAGESLEKNAGFFSSIRVERVHDGGTWSQRRPDRRETARFLSTVYNRFLTETPRSDLLWFVEDDIFVPPGAAEKLQMTLLEGDHPKAAVTGLYRSRFEDCFVAARVTDGRVIHTVDQPDEPESCDFSGTGCLMVLKPRARARFDPFWTVPANGNLVPAHDWHYTWSLKESGDPVWIEPAVRCRHFLNETEWV